MILVERCSEEDFQRQNRNHSCSTTLNLLKDFFQGIFQILLLNNSVQGIKYQR